MYGKMNNGIIGKIRQAFDTQAVFDALNGNDVMTKWQCRKCGPVPQANPQPAARIKKTARKVGTILRL